MGAPGLDLRGLDKGLESFRYLTQSSARTVDGIDDQSDFLEMSEALDTLMPTVKREVLAVTAAVLHLGSVSFEAEHHAKTRGHREEAKPPPRNDQPHR